MNHYQLKGTYKYSSVDLNYLDIMEEVWYHKIWQTFPWSNFELKNIFVSSRIYSWDSIWIYYFFCAMLIRMHTFILCTLFPGNFFVYFKNDLTSWTSFYDRQFSSQSLIIESQIGWIPNCKSWDVESTTML